MEQKTWNHFTSQLQNTPGRPPSLNLLASVRSLIANPSTSESTISAILAALTDFLRLSDNPIIQSHVVHLARDFAVRYPQHRRQIFDSIISNRLYAHDCARLAAESLSALMSISEIDESFRSELDDLGCDNLFVSLCFRPDVAVRAWLLSNFERFRVRSFVLVPVFLGFTKDPYPNVRRISLDGMVKLSKFIESDDDALANGCYCRAVELLQDSDDCVRRSAVRAVFEWGQKLVASSQVMKKRERSDTLFIQVCSMVRDMNAQVRIEAFNCVGNIEIVATEILLQSLSKKILLSTKNKKSLNHLDSKQLQQLASIVAGAYAHGLEDEFSEVRESACRSLQKWTVISPEFSTQAVNWLVDVLNDDSYSVRLSALDTMHHMAINRRLKLQDVHLHMFLGTLGDANLSIRSTTRKILQLIQFSNLEMFNIAVDGIIKTLDSYSQDEADVISLMFTVGKNHGDYVIGIINKITEEVALLPDGKIRPNSGRVTALLALAISTPLSNNQYICRIPPTIYSYAFTLLRRISFGLIDIMDESILLARLLKCSALTCSSIEFKEGESFLPLLNLDSISHADSENGNLKGFVDGPMNIDHTETGDEMDNVPASSEQGLEICVKVVEYAQLILDKFEGIWLLIQSGCMDEALRMLRCFKQEVRTVLIDTQEYGGLRFFLLQYLQVIELLATLWKQWVQSHPERKLRPCSHGELNIVLETLELTLREIRYRLVGLSCNEELHILELVLLTHVVRLSSIDLFSLHTSLSKLSAALLYMENLIEIGSVGPSKFIVELRKSLFNNSMLDEDSTGQNVFKKLLNLFSLRSLTLRTSFRLLKAELNVPGNNSENPLPFVSGLPIGVPLKVTLYNISRSVNMWVKMKMDDGAIQFVYVDQTRFGDCCEVTEFMCTLPFYNSPKAVSFILKVSIGVECIHEKDIYVSEKHMRGPKCDLTYLCEDVEIYFSSAFKD
ncbi:hypothetical protein QQ045_022162 [Rhodiola kirilowii]